MKKFIIAICLLTGLISCHHDDDDPPIPEDNRDRRTVLVYMAAENNLASFCTEDLNEMKTGSLTLQEDQNLIVYVDKAGSSTTPFLARVKGGELVDTIFMKEGLAADPTVLESAIRRTKELYPAKSYGLVLWGHASGWIISNSDSISKAQSRDIMSQKAYGGSTGTNSSSSAGKYWMNIIQMTQAISNALGSDKMKFILGDCCCFGCMEVAYELRNVTEYTIGSPAEIPDMGAPFHLTVPDMFNEADNFYEKLVQNYFDYYLDVYKTEGEKYYNLTPNDLVGYSEPMVVIQSSELDNLAIATAQILRTIPDKLNTTGSLDLNSIMFYSSYSGYYYSYDMYQVLKRNTSAADFNAWDAAFQKAIPCHLYSKKWLTNNRRLMYQMNDTFISEPADCGSVSMFFPSTYYNGTYPDWNKSIQLYQWNDIIHWEQYGW